MPRLLLEIFRFRQGRSSIALLLKQSHVTALIVHIGIQSSLLVREIARKSSAGSGLENGDERHFRSLARYLFKPGEELQASPRSNYRAAFFRRSGYSVLAE